MIPREFSDMGGGSADFSSTGRRFHHIGVACSDIDKEARHLSQLGYVPEGEDFVDPLQGIRGRFLTAGGPRLELVSQLQDGGVLSPWLDSGIKLYHLAYETADLEQSIVTLQAQRARLVVRPTPAVAFNDRHIAFLMLPNMLLVELIQD